MSDQRTVVAVAGGTGGVGKAIVQELRLHRERYQVIVFTRSRPKAAVDEHGTEYVQIDYAATQIDAVADLLRTRQVETVISTITIEGEKTRDAQLNLIRAAIKANDVTKRFIPSEFGYVNVEEILPFDSSVQHWLDAARLLASSPLQYTRIANGFFLDYLGMPYTETTMSPFTWVLDMYGRRAAIPSSGEQLMSWTHTGDVARYVVKLLGVAAWDEWTVVVGEDISFNALVALAERVRGGEIKFRVTYDSIDELDRGHATVLPQPGHTEIDPTFMGGRVQQISALFGRLYHHGILHMPTENRFSDRVRDEIQPLGVEEFLLKTWQGR